MANLQVDLDAEVQANLGTPMIYTLVTRAQEWLQDKARAGLGHPACCRRRHLLTRRAPPSPPSNPTEPFKPH